MNLTKKEEHLTSSNGYDLFDEDAQMERTYEVIRNLETGEQLCSKMKKKWSNMRMMMNRRRNSLDGIKVIDI